ncbi:hypothetical protein MSP8887_03838 [Marinomonas spartinae]|nr:hypothetical protein MSP8887_03838 [Marinomonas spartinae]
MVIGDAFDNVYFMSVFMSSASLIKERLFQYGEACVEIGEKLAFLAAVKGLQNNQLMTVRVFLIYVYKRSSC